MAKRFKVMKKKRDRIDARANMKRQMLKKIMLEGVNQALKNRKN